MKKILFFQWHSFMNKGMERALQKLEIPYDTFFYQFEDWEHDDRFLELFRKKIKECAYTDVLSVNFSPLVSQICEEVAIPYTAWVYDSPIHIRDTKCLFRSCNRLFFFDRGQAEEYQKAGVHFHPSLRSAVRLWTLPSLSYCCGEDTSGSHSLYIWMHKWQA